MHSHRKLEGIDFLGMKIGLLSHETEVLSNANTQQKNSWKQIKCTTRIKIFSEECKNHQKNNISMALELPFKMCVCAR